MENIQMIRIGRLHPHPDNPRKNLGDLTELTASIKASGIFQNLTVVPFKMTDEEYKKACEEYRANPTEEGQRLLNSVANGTEPHYTVIIGHRRLAAAKAAGLEELPCAIVEMTEAEQMRTMMVENMQRSDLTPLEQADGMQMMLDLGYSKEQISEETGFSRTTIDHRLKMRELNRKKLQEEDTRGGTISDYIKLEKIKDKNLRDKVLEEIGTDNFNEALEDALDEEKRKEARERIVGIVSKFAKEYKTKYSWESPNGYNLEKMYRLDTDNEDEVEEAKDGKDRVYTTGTYDVRVYVKEEKAKEKKNDIKDEVIKNFERWEKNCEKELKEITKKHERLRLNFIKEFGNFREHVEEIQTFSALINANQKGWYGRDIDRDVVEELSGIPKRKDKYRNLGSEWEDFCRKEPYKALLYVTVSKAEQGWQNQYWDDSYSRPTERICNEKVCYVFAAKESPALDLIYEFLSKLGYRESDEEKEMRSGAIVKRLLETMPAKTVKEWKERQRKDED